MEYNPNYLDHINIDEEQKAAVLKRLNTEDTGKATLKYKDEDKTYYIHVRYVAPRQKSGPTIMQEAFNESEEKESYYDKNFANEIHEDAAKLSNEIFETFKYKSLKKFPMARRKADDFEETRNVIYVFSVDVETFSEGLLDAEEWIVTNETKSK